MFTVLRLPAERNVRQEYFERAADSAIRKLESALWVGVTERLPESTCLLFLTLGKPYRPIGEYRVKTPRPISVRVVGLRCYLARLLARSRGAVAGLCTVSRSRLEPCRDVLPMHEVWGGGPGNTNGGF